MRTVEIPRLYLSFVILKIIPFYEFSMRLQTPRYYCTMFNQTETCLPKYSPECSFSIYLLTWGMGVHFKRPIKEFVTYFHSVELSVWMTPPPPISLYHLWTGQILHFSPRPRKCILVCFMFDKTEIPDEIKWKKKCWRFSIMQTKNIIGLLVKQLVPT